jgi:hypothetical protein
METSTPGARARVRSRRPPSPARRGVPAHRRSRPRRRLPAATRLSCPAPRWTGRRARRAVDEVEAGDDRPPVHAETLEAAGLASALSAPSEPSIGLSRSCTITRARACVCLRTRVLQGERGEAQRGFGTCAGGLRRSQQCESDGHDHTFECECCFHVSHADRLPWHARAPFCRGAPEDDPSTG